MNNHDYIVSEELLRIIDEYDRTGDVTDMYEAIDNLRIALVDGDLSKYDE